MGNDFAVRAYFIEPIGVVDLFIERIVESSGMLRVGNEVGEKERLVLTAAKSTDPGESCPQRLHGSPVHKDVLASTLHDYFLLSQEHSRDLSP